MKKRKKNHQLNNQGFSLLEVLVAFIVLAIVVVPFLHAFLSSSALNAKGRISSQATNLAENVFEGMKVRTYVHEENEESESATAESITSFTTESTVVAYEPTHRESIPHLENLAYMFNYPMVDGKNNFFVLPKSQVTGATIGQFEVKKSIAGDGTVSYTSTSPNLTSTDGGKTYNFVEETSNQYYFYILNAREQNQFYDVLITLDGSAYQKGAAASGKELNGVEMTRIPNIDTAKDAVISKSVETEAKVLLEKQLKNIGITDFKPENVKRKIIIMVNESEDATAVLVDYEMIYGYVGADSVEYRSGIKNVLDVKKEDFRNVFLMYEPLYNSTKLKLLDEIEIRNNKNSDTRTPLPFNFYIIKQERAGLTKLELRDKEDNYKVNVRVVDNSVTGSSAITIKTNLGTNLYKMYDSTATHMTGLSQAKYYENEGTKPYADNVAKARFHISEIYDHEVEANFFDVLIQVYEHAEGADFRDQITKFDGQPLAQFTGALQN